MPLEPLRDAPGETEMGAAWLQMECNTGARLEFVVHGCSRVAVGVHVVTTAASPLTANYMW
jgi:hypothetical protein